MKSPHKYLQVARITWKSITAYAVDTWLGAGMTGFRILLSLLLWLAIYQGQEEIAGYTLPVMITYTLLAALLGRLQLQDAMAWQLSNEVREGTFSKYLVLPVSVLGYFVSAGLGRWLYQVIVNAAALVFWGVVYSKWLVFPSTMPFAWMVLLVLAGAVCMLLFNHTISLLSLKYKEIGGVLMIKNGIVEFLTGAMIPLTLLPVPVQTILKFSPFYYVVYYPASLFLGKQEIQPITACLILLCWSIVFFLVSKFWFAKLHREYEGVGI
mgnify:CR=1 FL=1